MSRPTLVYGGHGGIRIHATIARPTPLAGEPLQPLEYMSIFKALLPKEIVHARLCFLLR